jgi:hypothetical protein
MTRAFGWYYVECQAGRPALLAAAPCSSAPDGDYSGLLRQTVCEDAWLVRIVGGSGVGYLSLTTSGRRQIAHTGVVLGERLVS